MQRKLLLAIGWLSGVVVVATAVAGTRLGPPPVVWNLGPFEPTPAPTPAPAQKKRLITTLTLQNSAAGDTVVTFEATEVAEDKDGKVRTLASKQYSLAEAEEKPELRPLALKILEQLRALEGDLLEFVEKSGPPKPRAPISGGGTRPR
ncbi:MAG: hypothetical protein N3C12_01895 [Candidatus Binatia bacterium]|nr:hypothetical protein [Candidatus Binatia bacterium]